MRICSYCGHENESSLVKCGQCGTELAVAPVTALPASRKPGVVCPACGVADQYKDVIPLRGSFSVAAYFFGGILGVIFLNASRRKRVQCNACGALFGVRSPVSRFSLIIFWLLVAPSIVVLVIALVSAIFSR